MEQKININCIGVIKENNGNYIYERIGFQESKELLTVLDSMHNNPNRTVLDMQDYFVKHFGTEPKPSYNCCLPHDYDSAFIGYASLPKMITIEQYHQDKQNVAEKKIERFKDIESWNVFLKEEFHQKAIRYIQATDFATATKNIKKDSRIRMLSHENIGWTTIKHKISDDLIITINTNFTYGSSSYFLLNVCYKGIDLLPYSLLVKYYYAHIADIKRCTRSYNPRRYNWALAMDFVADVGNKTKAGEQTFVRDWLKHEIDEMISRLYAIKENPRNVLDDVIGRRADLSGLCCVRQAYNSELTKINVYPEEMTIIFKASKLTTALDLIDKLQAAGEVYEPALEAVYKIREINRLLAPELDIWIAKNSVKLEKLARELQQPQEQLAMILGEIDHHNNEITNMFEADNSPNKLKSKTIKEYREIHPEFVDLEQSRDTLENIIRNINSRIQDYNNFTAILQKCYQKINDIVLKSA